MLKKYFEVARVCDACPPLALRCVSPAQLWEVAKLYKIKVEASSKKKNKVRAVLAKIIKGR